MAIDEGGLGAVHRLEAEELLVHLDLEHVLGVVLPVPRLLPEPLVDEDRGRDLLVAPGVLHLPRVTLQLPEHDHALREPEGRPGGDVLEHEEVQLPAELPVVPALGLFDAPEVAIQLLLARPRRPVDPLEHRAVLVPPPVGAGGGEELESPDVASRRNMGAAAEIDEVPLPIEGHAPDVGGEALEDLHLERLAPLLVVADRLVPLHLLAHDRVVSFGQLPHAGLDPAEIGFRERLGPPEVVVEPVLDRRADGEPSPRVDLAHRLRHEVSGRVPERRQGVGETVELPRSRQVRVCLVHPRPQSPAPAEEKSITDRIRDAFRFCYAGLAPSARPPRTWKRGRDGRSRTADLLCVRQALSH